MKLKLQNIQKLLFLLVFLIANVNLVNSATITTVKSGAWDDPATWGGSLPAWNADIIVAHNVSGTTVSIGWDQSLILNSNVTLDVTNFNLSSDSGAEINGTLNVSSDLKVQNGALTINTGGIVNVFGNMSNNANDGIFIQGGELIIYNDYTNKGNSNFTITDGGKLTILGQFKNTGSATFNVDNGDISISEDFINQGGSEIVIGKNGTMDIGGDFQNSSDAVVNGDISISGNLTNSGGGDISVGSSGTISVAQDFVNSADIVIDGNMDVGGIIENNWGGTGTGTGTVSVGSEIEGKNPAGFDANLLSIVSKIYAIAAGNWSNTDNWSNSQGGASCNCTPQSGNSVYTEDFNIDVDVVTTVKSIVISENSVLNIKPNAALTVNGSVELNGELILRSDATSSASFIDNDKISYGANAKFKTRLLLVANQFNYISSSYTNSPSDSIKYFRGVLNPNVYGFDESAADYWALNVGEENDANAFLGWVAPSATMLPGIGFAAWVPNNYYVELTGNALTTGKQTVEITETLHPSITNNTLFDGWNLVGNPYPAGLDLASFISVNTGTAKSDGNVYVWDDNGSNGDYSSLDYIQVNVVGSIDNTKGETFSGVIKANQAFFVKAVNPVSTLVFENTMRTSGGQTFAKSSIKTSGKTENIDRFKFYIESTNGKLYNESLIAFAENASEDVDLGYDGLKRKGNADIALYSLINGNHYGIQTLPFSEKITVPVGFDIAQNGSFVLGIDEEENTLPVDKTVFLKDNYTGNEVELKAGEIYTFEASAGANPDRFTLIFTRSDVTSVQNKEIEDNFNVFSGNKKITIQDISTDNRKTKMVQISDLTGKIIHQKQFSNKKGEFGVPTGNQIYFVRITEGSKISTYKVFVK